MLEIPKENKGHLRPSIKAPTMKDQDDKVHVILFGLADSLKWKYTEVHKTTLLGYLEFTFLKEISVVDIGLTLSKSVLVSMINFPEESLYVRFVLECLYCVRGFFG
jgi:hypothetical protein